MDRITADQRALRHPGRHQSERPADFDRNRWPTSIGMPGRHHRNPQAAQGAGDGEFEWAGLERLPLLAQDAVRRGHEISAHGWRWEGHADLGEAEERDRIARTVATIKNVTGLRPVGWHTRSPGSANTRRLLVEEGGFLYDSDAYNDDLPFFVEVAGKRHLVLPYAFDTNDMQFFHTNRFSGASDFVSYVNDAFDCLHREGAHAPKMMSIGLHLRIIGRPGRIAALDKILGHITDRGNAWIARRIDIANHWRSQLPRT